MVRKNLRGGTGVFVLLIILLLLAGILAIIYIVYQNIPGAPVILKPIVLKAPVIEKKAYAEVKQFYPNMKFNHNSISYFIDTACNDKKKQRMREAFDMFARLVKNVSFYEVFENQNPDIEVSCSEQEEEETRDYFIAGEGGAKEIVPTERYNVISQGIILLYKDVSGFLECDWANVELHELTHVFGFDHSENPNSLMYEYLENCEQELDKLITDELNLLYSEENLADLYFEDLNVIKKRKYLDFNLTVKNSGVINAQNVIFGVFDNDELVDSFDLKDEDGEIKYGAGIIISIENLKLNNINSDNIEFIIDYDNLIKEIDEDNNLAQIGF